MEQISYDIISRFTLDFWHLNPPFTLPFRTKIDCSRSLNFVIILMAFGTTFVTTQIVYWAYFYAPCNSVLSYSYRLQDTPVTANRPSFGWYMVLSTIYTIIYSMLLMERFCRIHYFIDVKYLINGSANKPHVKEFKQILHVVYTIVYSIIQIALWGTFLCFKL